MNYCPERAIETAHSMVFLLLLVLTVVINPYLSTKVADFVAVAFCGSRIAFESFYFMVQWSVALLLFYLGYKFLHLLMRFPLINRLITYTSLTTWKFWRRYKIPRKASVSDK
jgi:hypothetical protein